MRAPGELREGRGGRGPATGAVRPRHPAAGGRRHHRHPDAGSLAVFQAAWLLAITVLVGLALLDVGTLLRGARVAAAAADGAALAAATATRNASPVSPIVAADRVAAVHGARVSACRCDAPPVRVDVVLPVETRLLADLGVTEVRASATARLVRQPPRPAGSSP